jgi:hypothetical protein
MRDLKEYASCEADSILKGERLVAPEMLMERWQISRKEVMKLANGHHPSGVFLPSVRFGSKTVRFRLTDVVEVEYRLYET